MLYSTLALGVLLAAAPAHAQNAGDACDKTLFGETKLADSQTDIIGCLYTDNTKTALVWKSAYGGNSGGSYITQLDPSSGTSTCLAGNPTTTAGSCSCPSGYMATPTSYSANYTASTANESYTDFSGNPVNFSGEQGGRLLYGNLAPSSFNKPAATESFTCIQGSAQSGRWVMTAPGYPLCQQNNSGTDISGQPCSPLNNQKTENIPGGGNVLNCQTLQGSGFYPVLVTGYTCE